MSSYHQYDLDQFIDTAIGKPNGREAIDRGLKKAKAVGLNIPDEVANDFYDLTAHESGRSHYSAPGVVKLGPPTKTGERAIGFGQIMPKTALPYQKQYGLDPNKEEDNIAMSLNEFYKGDPNDPIARRIAYVAGPKSPALYSYRKTGKVPDKKLYSYLPNNNETFKDYVTKSGGYKHLDNFIDGAIKDQPVNKDDLDDFINNAIAEPQAQSAQPVIPPSLAGPVAQAVDVATNTPAGRVLANTTIQQNPEIAQAVQQAVAPPQTTLPDNPDLQAFAADLKKANPAATDQDVLDAYNLMEKGRVESQNQQNAQQAPEQNQPQQTAQGVTRLPSQLQTVNRPLTDEEIGKTDVSYQVPVTKADTPETIQQKISAKLQEDWGLKPDQTGKLVDNAPPSPGEIERGYAVVNVNRGKLAALAGADKVRQDLNQETTSVETDPTYLENLEKAGRGQAANLPDKGFDQMSEAEKRLSVGMGGVADAFISGLQKDVTGQTSTWEEKVARENDRIRMSQLSPETIGALSGVGNLIKTTNPGRTDFASGLAQQLADAPDLVAGAARALADLGIISDQTYTSISKGGSAMRVLADNMQHKTPLGKVLNAAGQLTVALPEYAGLAELPGGAYVMFGIHGGLTAAGRGEDVGSIAGSVVRGVGAAAGLKAGEVAGKAATEYIAPAVEGLTGEAAIKQLYGVTAKVGTVATTTGAINAATGLDIPRNAQSMIEMSLLSLVPEGTQAVDYLGGKIFRFSGENGGVDVTVGKDGSIEKLAKPAANENVSIEFGVSDSKLLDQIIQKTEGRQLVGKMMGEEAPPAEEKPAGSVALPEELIPKETPKEEPPAETPSETPPEEPKAEPESGGGGRTPAPVAEDRPYTTEDIDKEMADAFPTKGEEGGKETSTLTLEKTGDIGNPPLEDVIARTEEKGPLDKIISETENRGEQPPQEPPKQEVSPEEAARQQRQEEATQLKTAMSLPLLTNDKVGKKKLDQKIAVTYESPSGKTVNKQLTAAQMQKQIEGRMKTLHKLVDCIHE